MSDDDLVFTGLSAFPLTPWSDRGLDEAGLARLVIRLVRSGVDSIGALGSTGGYAYLDRAERAAVARVVVASAGDVPVLVGVGALRTTDVLAHVADAQEAGAAGVLLAPLTYQPLTPDEVHGLYADVSAEVSVPLVVYDNPSTTGVHFTDELHGAIARLPHVASIKIPPVSTDPIEARARVDRLRASIPDHVTIGISGDPVAVDGLLAGCDAWYSVLAGLLPETALEIVRAAQIGDAALAHEHSARLQPVWDLFTRYGSYRVATALAQILGLVDQPYLPRPVRPLPWPALADLDHAVRVLTSA